mgnify:CR=1 FL=1
MILPSGLTPHHLDYPIKHEIRIFYIREFFNTIVPLLPRYARLLARSAPPIRAQVKFEKNLFIGNSRTHQLTLNDCLSRKSDGCLAMVSAYSAKCERSRSATCRSALYIVALRAMCAQLKRGDYPMTIHANRSTIEIAQSTENLK